MKNLFDAVKAYCIRILPNRIPAIIKAPLGTCSLKAQVEVVATTCVSPKRAVALEVKRLYSSGVSLRSIALQLKLARQTVCKYAKLDIEIACTYKKSRERKIELANYHDQILSLDGPNGCQRLMTTLGRNAFTLEQHGSKLHVCSTGGVQGDGTPNPGSKLDIIDLANTSDPTGLAFTKAFMASDIVGELRDITFTKDGNAYVLAGHYTVGYTAFDGCVLQFPADNVTPDNLTGIYFFPTTFPNQGSVFAVLANDNNRIWLARGMYVDLCAQDVELGEALIPIDTKAAYEINGPSNTYYLNSVTLYGEDPTATPLIPQAKRGYQAPAFASNSVRALFERQRLVREEEEKRQAIRAKIAANRKK
ncbi:MAG: hypothetical protein K0R55_4139 [Sporomusa sp.]|nr:hypothetical protein [Sporomusa sp.]